jgi:geranylgeranyl reductase family protein
MEARDAVVVGGGPAGAATALFLRQRGLDVLLLDEAAFPRDKICGESVSPEAWRILRSLGAAEAVARREPRPVHGMRLTSPDGTSFSGRYRGTSDAGFALRRSVLDELLLCCVRTAGVEVRERTRVLDLLFENDRVCGVRCGSPQEPHVISARLVVGADGRRSVVARRLGLLTEHPSLRKFAVRGHWDGMQGLDEYGEMHVLEGGYCGVAPLGDGVANVAFVLDRREMREAGGDLEGFYRRTLRRWHRLAERLAQARLLAPPRAIGPLALSARRVSAPGALLVGDSAGFYDPFTGEGVTLALRSAELAAEVAIPALAGGGPCADLSAYDRSRHAATKDKFLLNRLLQRIVAWPALSNAVARRLACRPDLADRLVGIAGDFVPARSALGPAFLWELLRG